MTWTGRGGFSSRTPTTTSRRRGMVGLRTSGVQLAGERVFAVPRHVRPGFREVVPTCRPVWSMCTGASTSRQKRTVWRCNGCRATSRRGINKCRRSGEGNRRPSCTPSRYPARCVERSASRSHRIRTKSRRHRIHHTIRGQIGHSDSYGLTPERLVYLFMLCLLLLRTRYRHPPHPHPFPSSSPTPSTAPPHSPFPMDPSRIPFPPLCC